MTRQTQTLLAGRRILVVEDEYFLADELAGQLRDLGADVAGPYGEIEPARQLLEDRARIDGALLDINVGSEMIFPLARTLRARNIPFAFTTGYDRRFLATEFAGVQLWEKPLSPADVVGALADMILQR